MSPFVVAFIAFVLALIFRLLNFSQPMKPKLVCRDEKFANLLRDMAPELEQKYEYNQQVPFLFFPLFLISCSILIYM